MDLQQEEFTSLLGAVFRRNGLEEYISRAESFYALFRLLASENEKYNLTSVVSPEQVILKHYADSLSVASLLPIGARVLDIGAGAGFPSLPLAICRPDLKITALDATEKKTGFIALAARELGLSGLETAWGRAEELAHTPLRFGFDIALARAVSSARILCELGAPFLKKGGTLIAMKASSAPEEAAEAAKAAHALGLIPLPSREFTLSGGEETLFRAFLVWRRTGDCPEKYPRSYAKIKAGF